MTALTVELSTAQGLFFSGSASAVEVRTEDGSIHINPDEECHLSMTRATEIALMTPEGHCIFELENAVAGLKDGRFTVLAERISRVEPAPNA